MSTPRQKQAAAMTRLMKRRGDEKKRPAAGHLMTFKFWVSMCRPHEAIKSPIVQRINGKAVWE